MKRIVKLALPLAVLIIIAGAGYWFAAQHKLAADAKAAQKIAQPSKPMADGAFPESQLNNLTPQINQVATNIAQFIDSGNSEQIGKVWDASASIAQQSVTRENFVANLAAAHQTFGDLVKRDYIDTRYKAFSEAGSIPAGQYITVNYQAQFANDSAPRKESVVFVFGHGQWKLAGYSILAAQ